MKPTTALDELVAEVEHVVKVQTLERACSQSFLGNLHVDPNLIYIGSNAGKRALNELKAMVNEQ